MDSPGPASAEGVISSRGSTNFSHPGWRNFDFRGALQERLQLPVIYNNDANAAALYAHYELFGPLATQCSSISVVVGTGLGGGVIEKGRVIKGAAGFAGELGHIHVPMEGLLGPEQPLPRCNCGFSGDAESVASLTGHRDEPAAVLARPSPGARAGGVGSISKAAKLVRSYAEKGDPLALRIFEQQAMALGRLFTIAAAFTDPEGYFVGGGVVETAPHFREWFLAKVRENTALKEEQAAIARFAVVPHLDMAGARGAALAALRSIRA